MKNFIFKLQYLFIFICLQTSCGFHLAGTGEFANSLQNTSVHSDIASRELLIQIERALSANQINIVDIEQATAIINVKNEEAEKVVLTVDSDGKAREFELILRVSFDVKRSDNSYLLSEQNIQLSRDFVFDKRDLLGANEEEQQLFNEMKSDAAKLIVYRLQAITE